MSQLTGSQTGTAQADFFTGEVQAVDLTANPVNTGIFGATIDGLGGDDTIKGTATLKPSSLASPTSYGIANSTITDSGIDDDVFLGTGTSEGFDNQGTATGYGLYSGSVNGGAGDDLFRFSGTGQSALTTKGVGAAFTTVDGGTFNDRMFFSGLAIGRARDTKPVSATAYGVQGSTVKAGSEKDSVEVSAIARSVNSGNGSANSVAIGVKGSWVLGEGGDDGIAVTATSEGLESFAKGASAGLIDGGADADLITLSAISQGVGIGSIALAVGIELGSVVKGGDSADVINIRGEASSDVRGVAYGVQDSSVIAGNDNDAVFISATSSGVDNAFAYGISGSKNTNTGQGDDRLIVSATATSQGRAAAYGLYESDVFTGDGNDQIVITSTSQVTSGSGGVGAFKSRIVAGAGNDSIKVVAEDRAEFDISDSIIFGEGGDDTINVGIGSGQTAGGGGNDLVILDYFKADTMKIAAIDGVIRISGTQTKSGVDQAWSQDIFGVERFQIGDTIYSAQSLVSEFLV